MLAIIEEAFDDTIKTFWNMPIVIVCTIIATGVAIFWEWRFGEMPEVSQLKLARSKIREAIEEHDCGPILVRLAWHDAGTYDKTRDKELGWPEGGGATGSIRTKHEIFAAPNAGLQKALSKYLSPIKELCPLVSWADLVQLASATAIESAGGPVINMKYGRCDGNPERPPPSPFGLPDAVAPFGGPPHCEKDPAQHLKVCFVLRNDLLSFVICPPVFCCLLLLMLLLLFVGGICVCCRCRPRNATTIISQWVFGKYGMGDRDIVALSGAHTLGRAFSDRSGAVTQSSEASAGTKYTAKGFTDGTTGFVRLY
jgi:L-ascorbate peroxidase